MMRALLCAALGLALSGCATRGSIDITCNGFATYSHRLPQSRLERDIHRDVPGHGPKTMEESQALVAGAPDIAMAEADPMARAMVALARGSTDSNQPPFLNPTPKPVLLLSGGGQWGAFGAGLLQRLHEKGGTGATDFGVITGVSTGGVQSLFVAINDSGAFDALIKAYSPEKESDVVNRPGMKEVAAITGALAGLKPLRRRIEAALCTNGNPALGCPLIDALARADRQVYIGFIQARTGEFLYADAVAIAQSAATDRANAQQCLTAVAMASAAMPVFYQQLKINHETYFDGGVRRSVFEASVADLLERGVRQAQAEAIAKGRDGTSLSAPALYVIRNGPTQLLGPGGVPAPDPDADKKLSALTAALRAESIVVNELEVGSIASLRLAHPTGPILLATADGYTAWPAPNGEEQCRKPKDVMFDPKFMDCLRNLGRYKADWPEPWIALSDVGTPAKTATEGK